MPPPIKVDAHWFYSNIDNEGVRVQKLAKYAGFDDNALFRQFLASGVFISQFLLRVAQIMSTRGLVI